jgi:hypothetical protein
MLFPSVNKILFIKESSEFDAAEDIGGRGPPSLGSIAGYHKNILGPTERFFQNSFER